MPARPSVYLSMLSSPSHPLHRLLHGCLLINATMSPNGSPDQHVCVRLEAREDWGGLPGQAGLWGQRGAMKGGASHVARLQWPLFVDLMVDGNPKGFLSAQVVFQQRKRQATAPPPSLRPRCFHHRAAAALPAALLFAAAPALWFASAGVLPSAVWLPAAAALPRPPPRAAAAGAGRAGGGGARRGVAMRRGGEGMERLPAAVTATAVQLYRMPGRRPSSCTAAPRAVTPRAPPGSSSDSGAARCTGGRGRGSGAAAALLLAGGGGASTHVSVTLL